MPERVLVPRGLTIEQAAAYCGIDVATFGGWRRWGLVPPPMRGTYRYDKVALDAALTQLSEEPAVVTECTNGVITGDDLLKRIQAA